MRRNLLFLSILSIGLLLGSLGALVLLAQYLEWQSYGNWNAVSLRYALAYFNVQLPLLNSPTWRVWDLPLSAVLIGLGAAIAVVGIYCWRKSSRQGNVMHSSQH
jgi:hypothetical protein